MLRTLSSALAAVLTFTLASAQEPPPPIPRETPKAQPKEPAPAPHEAPKAQPAKPATEAPQPERAAAADAIREQLGLKFAVFTSKLRRKAIRTETPYGFQIAQVTAGSPAATAGLVAGDVVLTVDGQPFEELAALAEALQAKQPGEVLALHGSRLKKNRKLLDRHPWEDFDVEVRLPETAQPPKVEPDKQREAPGNEPKRHGGKRPRDGDERRE